MYAEEVIPTWRGRSHAYAFWLALAAAAALFGLAPTAEARAASGVYGAALCALFAISGLYHRWRWNPRWRPLLRRLDHTPLVLLAAGGVLYALGAAVYATRRPNPWPLRFGFHEVFHGMVVAAAASHFLAMVIWIVPSAT